jgi:sugar lactone lactonase YvrE
VAPYEPSNAARPLFGRREILFLLAGIMAATIASLSPARSITAPQVETLASFPHGTFLENLAIGPNGDVIFTDYTGKRLLRQIIGPADGTNGVVAPAATFAALDVHPAGIARLGEGYLVSAHGKSFLDGPAFSETQLLLVLDASGKEISRLAAPSARFLNGIAVGPNGLIVIADSAAGSIWRFDSKTNTLIQWLKSPLLEADPTTGPGRPGVNGLKFHAGKLYLSNSSRGAIFTVGLTREMRPAAVPRLYARTGPVDDFAFDADGSIVAATHGPNLIRISRRGKIETILDKGCDSCTAVARSPDSRGYLVLTTGNLLENSNEPARLLRVGGSRPSPYPR